MSEETPVFEPTQSADYLTASLCEGCEGTLLEWLRLPQILWSHIIYFEWWSTDGVRADSIHSFEEHFGEETLDSLGQLEEDFERLESLQSLADGVPVQVAPREGVPTDAQRDKPAEQKEEAERLARDARREGFEREMRAAQERGREEHLRRTMDILNAQTIANRDR